MFRKALLLLAAEGANAAQAHAGSATCAASRAMTMTGRYPTRTGFQFDPTLDGMSRIVPMVHVPEGSGLQPIRVDRARRRTPTSSSGQTDRRRAMGRSGIALSSRRAGIRP
jgi:uncharacterized sulfatase